MSKGDNGRARPKGKGKPGEPEDGVTPISIMGAGPNGVAKMNALPPPEMLDSMEANGYMVRQIVPYKGDVYVYVKRIPRIVPGAKGPIIAPA